jgi:uncharacterized protein YecT (DUF1311 family)
MKKRYIIFFLCFGLFGIMATAHAECPSTPIGFDTEYCAAGAYLVADQELYGIDQLIIGALPASQQVDFNGQETAWLQRRDMTCDLNESGRINQCVNKPTSRGVLKGGFLEECGDLF